MRLRVRAISVRILAASASACEEYALAECPASTGIERDTPSSTLLA